MFPYRAVPKHPRTGHICLSAPLLLSPWQELPSLSDWMLSLGKRIQVNIYMWHFTGVPKPDRAKSLFLKYFTAAYSYSKAVPQLLLCQINKWVIWEQTRLSFSLDQALKSSHRAIQVRNTFGLHLVFYFLWQKNKIIQWISVCGISNLSEEIFLQSFRKLGLWLLP